MEVFNETSDTVIIYDVFIFTRRDNLWIELWNENSYSRWLKMGYIKNKIKLWPHDSSKMRTANNAWQLGLEGTFAKLLQDGWGNDTVA